MGADRTISIHAPRTGSDVDFRRRICAHIQFQSTLPARGATIYQQRKNHRLPISIHAPRTGSDGTVGQDAADVVVFQSTLPARGATFLNQAGQPGGKFQSTLPARGATPIPTKKNSDARDFNPRSPHGERRRTRRRNGETPPDFNPRSPHGERHGRRRTSAATKDFNPRSPHGERQRFPCKTARFLCISIHAPRTGSDPAASRAASRQQFQSTLPARGATKSLVLLTFDKRRFQSTLPARGATSFPTPGLSDAAISIHAPRTGSDQSGGAGKKSRHAFQSTLPARGATLGRESVRAFRLHFNPRSPHGERLLLPRPSPA